MCLAYAETLRGLGVSSRLIDMINEKCVETADGCVVWSSRKSGQAYVTEGGKQQPILRVLWEHCNGPLPVGVKLFKTCDDTRCINLEHVVAVTPNEFKDLCRQQIKGVRAWVGFRGTETERFWRKVEKTETCWYWTASTNSQGYGEFHVAPGKRMLAHRYAYMVHHGLTEPALPAVVEHNCDNPRCVRPDHLVAGSQLSNVRSMFDRERSGLAKVSRNDVVVIRERAAQGEQASVLIAEFGITRKALNDILVGKTWQFCGGPRSRRKPGTSTLSPSRVRDIKEALLLGEDVTSVAKMYCVSKSCITQILYNRTWKEVPWPIAHG